MWSARILNSTLDPQWIGAQVHDHYGVAGRCTLHARGTHDTYRLHHTEQTTFFRVYRAGLRSPSDVTYEIDVLRHAASHGVAVAAPLARTDGEWITRIDAPEGERCAVLFAAAPGTPVDAETATAEHIVAYGQSIARFHEVMAHFPGAERRGLGSAELIDRPLRWLSPHLATRPDWRDTLERIVTPLRAMLEGRVGAACPRGVCHGDLHGGNALWAAHGVVTLFDFDECGHGWLTYDLAAFHWMAERAGQLDAWWPLLHEGYASVRPLSNAEEEALPWFVLARHLWQLGYDAWDNRFSGQAAAEADITRVLQSLEAHAAAMIR